MGFFEKLFGKKKGRIGQTWDDPLDIAVITTREVIDGKLPVVLVIHDEGIGRGWGGWQFLDGRTMEGREPVAIAKPDLLKLDPTLAQVTDLEIGWCARREGKEGSWFREPVSHEKDGSPEPKSDHGTDADISPEASAFLDAAITEFNQKMESLDEIWHFNEAVKWDFDQDASLFTISFQSGNTVVADAHALGSFCPGDLSWEWGWNNPNCTRQARKACSAVRVFGDKHGIRYLTDGKFDVPNEEYVSYLTAIGLKVLGAKVPITDPQET